MTKKEAVRTMKKGKHSTAPLRGSGAALITIERDRQIKAEKWSEKHDDEHRRMEMTRAATAYALNVWRESKLIETVLEDTVLSAAAQLLWPWGHEWWKPTDDPVRTLVKAGALIAAEIDRLNRERERQPNGGDKLLPE